MLKDMMPHVELFQPADMDTALALMGRFGSDGWAELREQNRLERLMVDGTHDEKQWPGLAYPSYETIGAGLDAFAAAVEGGPPFPITPDQIRHGVAVFEAIVRSAETGEKVRVD